MLKNVLWNILQTVVFIGALCATLLNVWLNTKTYVNENRVTLVTWEPVKDSYPFLRGLRLKIFLNYGKSTIFEELWATLNSFGIDESSYENVTKDLEEFESHFNKNDESLPFEMRYRVSQTLKHISLMDSEMQSYIMSVFRDTREIKSKLESYSVLQNLLQNPDYLLKLANSTWRILQPSLIENSFEGKPSFELFALDHLEPSYAVVSAKLQEMLDPKISVKRSAVLSNVLHYNMVPSINGTADVSLQVAIHPFKSDPIEISNTEQTVITLVITNIGILDRKETTDCIDNSFTDKSHEDIDLVDDQETDHCHTLKYIETMVQICRCIPFAYRRQFAMINQPGLSFCTPDLYLNCSKRINTAVLKSKRCLPLCTQAKNQYSVFITKVKAHVLSFGGFNDAGGMITRRPSAILHLRCNDAVYGMYTEKVLVTVQQYISQIGGDIGLYLGFSILGIWQFLVSICRSYKRTTSKNGGSEHKCSQVFRRVWTVVSSDQLLSDLHDGEVTSNSISELQARLTELESQMKLVMVRFVEELQSGIAAAVAEALEKRC